MFIFFPQKNIFIFIANDEGHIQLNKIISLNSLSVEQVQLL